MLVYFVICYYIMTISEPRGTLPERALPSFIFLSVGHHTSAHKMQNCSANERERGKGGGREKGREENEEREGERRDRRRREDGVRQERWVERGAMKEKRILGRRVRRNLFLSAFIQ